MSNKQKKFVILVCAGPYTHQAADSAIHFARAVIKKGHNLRQVFFYYDGVYLASGLASPEQAERKINAEWREFALTNNIDLVVCSNTAMKRGILDAQTAKHTGKQNHNLGPGFTMAGLGQFADAVLDCDRLVNFGA